MRVLVSVLLLVGCGRLQFDARTDASTVDGDPDSGGRAWWDPAWGFRMKLVIDNSTGPLLQEFPLLVRLDPTRIDYGDAHPTGADIRFVDSDQTTPLTFDIERWGNPLSIVWVRVPLIAAGAQHTIYLYYGNMDASSAASSPNTWSLYSAVYHPAAIPPGAAKELPGSTIKNPRRTQGTMPPGAQNTGILGGSLGFDGVDDFITAPNSASLALTGDLTIQMWVFLTAVREQWLCDFVVPGSESEANNHLYEFDFDTSNNLELQWEYGPGTDELTETATTVTTPTNTWFHVAATRNATTRETRFYIDGAPFGTPISYVNNATGGTASNFFLAGEIDGTSTKFTLAGRLDEVRLIDKVLGPALIAADYRSMTDQLITYYAPEPF